MNQLDAKSVVVGVNGSQAAVNAAKWAIDEALSRQVPLRLVDAIPRAETRSASPRSEWEMERGEMALSRAECAVRSEGKPVEVERAILAGDPAQVLVDESQDVALVCVGTARRGWASDGLVGSTAPALVAHARCPVAIIRSDPDGSPTELGVIAVVLNDEPDNDEVVHLAMEDSTASPRYGAADRSATGQLGPPLSGCTGPDGRRRLRRGRLREAQQRH